MDILSILFLLLHIVIIGLSVWIGYRRALGRSLVRLTYLIVIGVASFFLGKLLSSLLSGFVMGIVHKNLPAELQNALLQSPELEPLIGNIIGALLAPVLFALLFGILELLTLICFKKLSTRIVSSITKKEESPKWSNWAGAASGLVIGIAIAAVLLSPMYVLVNVAENTSEETAALLSGSYEQEKAPVVPDGGSAMRVYPTGLALKIRPSFKTTSFFPWEKPLTQALTTYKIHGATEANHCESLLHSLPVLLDVSGDAIYAYNVTIENGGEPNDALSNAAATVIPHLDESDTVKYISADAIHALGCTLQNGEPFFGIELPKTDDKFASSVVTHLVDALAHTTPETAKDNMITLFGEPTISYDAGATEMPAVVTNKGLLTTMTKIDAEDPLSSLRGEDTLTLVGSLAENDNMSAMLDDIHQYTTDLIEESGINLADQQYESFYNDVKNDISTQISNHVNSEGSTVTDVAKDIESTLGGYLEEHNIDLDDMQVSVVSVSIAKEFLNEEYIKDGELDISIKDLMDFFGLDESQIPEWAH